MGAKTRETAAYAKRRVGAVSAAVLIGTSEALPPLRSGYGGASVLMEGNFAGAPVASSTTRKTAPSDTTAEVTTKTTAPVAETDSTAPVAPVVTEEAAPLASTTTLVSPTDDLNIDAALSPGAPMEVGQLRMTGRTAASGRSRNFPSLDRVALSAAQRLAAIRLHGQRFTGALRQAWFATRNAREVADLQSISNHWNAGRHEEARTLAREAFDRHRNRFWRAVRADPALRAIFTDAGMVFPSGGNRPPIYVDPTTGDQLDFMSLEHQTRLADDPTLALDPSNLQTVLGDENSVTLEWIRRNDPFQ